MAAGSVQGISESEKTFPLVVTRCEDCPTEYSISFCVHDDGKSVEIILDVWQNLGPCRSPLDPGWVDCWGSLNPRFHGANQEDTWRTNWFQSDVSYVGDEVVFPTGSGQSAAAHSSAVAVRECWEEVHSGYQHPTRLRGPISVVPNMTKYQFDTLKKSVISAQYNGYNIRTKPPFPFVFRGPTGPIPYDCLKYTRSPKPRAT